ncbi:Wzz/FepE/Etk N-terminal domain-containing protein [Carboxylicivirga linearis]|uniref:Lipopolysaccharide biosynthesis protein n=1 Tax=Carboxylicivirga linearis TaxID=1628157 RepID=A0ABS5JQF6_9BACT|nr:Wzz/FepE/Etk N-terminal domain-containing protein [Carboxylicivirga linearis]MBS2097098.1 lipopolysaccharide biosynthesis protein [Carboxylicivirga linearis]
MEQKHISPEIEDDEIDLIAIAKTIWDGRRIIIKSVIVFTIIGLFVAIFSPKEYVASCIFVPQVSDAKASGGSLSGLAAMAGISLGSGGQSAEISPAIYPQVIAGTSFCKELMATKIKVSDIEQEVSFFEYFKEIKSPSVVSSIKKYTIGLPGVIKNAILPKKESELGGEIEIGVETLTEDEYKIKQLIGDILSLEVDDKVGYVSISAKMPEAYSAAQVAKSAQDLLQKYVTDYKISNAQKDLNFVVERFAEKEKEFYLAQEELAKYTDQNKNITSAYIKAQYERLSSDYQLKFNIYNELAKQLEQAKIKVTEDTPTFNTIQKVTVPNEKAAPKRGLIMVVFVFLGGASGIGIVYGKTLLAEVKTKWIE